MKNEFLKTLWMLRFEKMRRNEDEAAWKYQEVIDQFLIEFGMDEEVVPLLQQLVREEKAHARLVDELMGICRKTHPECEDLSGQG